jgi:alanyl-tRNA synthetase
MKSKEIRDRFLRFFDGKDHLVLPSSSLIPEDPSLLLTTAGMVQFVPVFKGEVKPKHPRVTTAQRCLRTTDIERIGTTARHLTFFEMLGNFSFGDYYKKDAIPWAWEFLTKDLKMDIDRLWITIFRDDDEAFDVWHKGVGIPIDRIVRLGEEDNFWSAGPTGLCGPSSEIIYDFGEDFSCGPDCGLGCDCDRWVEVWNLVFMQYNRNIKGELEVLPKKNIDTGMGLERAAAILQGVTTTFETDLIFPLVETVASIARTKYKESKGKDISLKIIADHVRAIVFMINDGILPSNEGRGYVLRRILRRAVRHGRLLGVKKPFLTDLADEVYSTMGDAHPEIRQSRGFVEQIVQAEEERFLNTLRQGLTLLDDYIMAAKRAGDREISAGSTFKLYDTFGFPLELTEEIAAEKGLHVDRKGFYTLMEKQREVARGARQVEVSVPKEIYSGAFDQYGPSKFVGYTQLKSQTTLQAIIVDNRVSQKAEAGQAVEVVLGRTPFYAEMGGQVGDTGFIETDTGRVKVADTLTPHLGLIVHKGKVVEGEIAVGSKATASVDGERRLAVGRNHTATHLLHWALRVILGSHVRQAGSLVDEERLRFDFTNPTSLSREELKHIEMLVNRKIVENHPVRAYTTTHKFAIESGALAFFGEKYGRYVRVLEVGDFSRELCGGTHLVSTGQIGLFKIVSESSVGANLRRIEAVTGLGSVAYLEKQGEILEEIGRTLKAGTAELVGRLQGLLSTLKEKEREVELLRSQMAKAEVERMIREAKELLGIKMIVSSVEGKDMNALRLITDDLKNCLKPAVIVLGSTLDRGVSLVVGLTPDLVKKGLSAVKIIQPLAEIIGGGGGGRTDLAQAGGRIPEKLGEALKVAEMTIPGMITFEG